MLSRVSLGSYSSSEGTAMKRPSPCSKTPVCPPAGRGLRRTVTVRGATHDLGANSLPSGASSNTNSPRAAPRLHHDRIVSFSEVELLSVDATDRTPQLSGRLELALPVNRVFLAGIT
jgi:hypothetical protein